MYDNFMLIFINLMVVFIIISNRSIDRDNHRIVGMLSVALGISLALMIINAESLFTSTEYYILYPLFGMYETFIFTTKVRKCHAQYKMVFGDIKKCKKS